MIMDNEMTNIKKGRLANLDMIRGLCILYVVFYHMSTQYGLISHGSTNGHDFFDVMSFFMTPFYVFSGFLFSCKREPKAFVMNKIQKLIIPYLFWSGLSIVAFLVYQYFSMGIVHLASVFEGFPSTLALRSDTPLWFFISLFAVSVIYYFIHQCLSNRQKDFFILLCFVFAYIVHNRLQLFSWGNISLGLVYYHLGYLFRKWSSHAGEAVLARWFVVAVAVFVLFNIFAPQNMSFVLLVVREGNFMLNLPYSLSACFILWFITRKIDNTNLISRTGQYSLTLYASHRIILNWCFDPIVRYIKPGISYCEYMLIGGGIILVIYMILLLTLKRYCPRLIGL